MNGKERIVSALNLEPVDRTPVWFMRQADGTFRNIVTLHLNTPSGNDVWISIYAQQ